MAENRKPDRSRARSRASDILLWLAALAIAAVVFALYINTNVFNSAHFADRAQAALEEPEIRDQISEDIGDLVVNEIAEDAVAVRPLIDSLSGAVIESTAFKRLFRSAALQLHSAAVAGDADSAVLTIANVGILITQALRQLEPTLAKQIPAGFDESLIRIADFDSVDALAQAARVSHRVGWIVTLLALLLVIAAFVVSVNRLRTVGRFGYSLIVAGAILAAGYFLARFLALRPAVSSGLVERRVGELVWDAFMFDLFTIALVMIALGAVTAVVADGALSGVRVQDRARRLARFATPPAATLPRVLWSIMAILIGIWLAFDPLGAVKVAVAVAGLFVIAAGMQELALLSTSAAELAATETPHERRRQRNRFVRIAAVTTIGLFVAVTVVGAVHVGGGLQSLGIVRDAQACNGDRALCDRPLNEVAIAATHNSMSVATNSNWLFPAQEESIGTQLADGIHGLLIDVYYAYPGRRVYTDTVGSSPKARSQAEEEFGKEFVAAADRIRRTISKPQGVDPKLFLCHGFCELGATPLSDAMADLRKYLEQNPREVVIVVFEDYVPWQDLAAQLKQSGLTDYAYDGPWGPKWPTLGEMIDDGGRLLLMTEKAEPKIPWLHNAFESVQETPFHFSDIQELRARSSCDPMRGSAKNTLFQMNHWIDTAPNPRPSIARRVNRYSFLHDRVDRCERIRDLLANIIAVDFYKEGDLFGVVDDLNAKR